jgi:hypothetical protein
MRFEHLVQINDPLNPLQESLDAAQLWQGLVLRAEQPQQFVMGLAGFAIHGRATEEEAITLARTLDFGSFSVHDKVLLTPPFKSQTLTEAGPTWAASRLTITIETPEAESLFLRFVYEFDEAKAETDAHAAEILALRRQAYHAADLDTVARIRTLVAMGA